MKNVNIVQIILLIVSGLAIIAAVIMFAAYRSGSGGEVFTDVVIWGTIPEQTFMEVVRELQADNDIYQALKYIEKDSLTYEDELLQSLAEGTGPDLVLLTEKQVVSNQPRMQQIPFESFPLRTYQDMFLEEGNLLVTQTGIIGFPFLIDPLVMYYNKDILSNNGYARPPETWTEILSITPTITQKDSSFNITKSTIALGSYDNITNAKDIFWMLTLQAGNPVIERYMDDQDATEKYRSVFNNTLNFTLNPAYASTNFFTQFSNPTKTVYTWNRSLPQSQTSFVSGDLAFYLGYASEFQTIRRINPNLNFDVTLVPQSQSSDRKVTYGSMSLFTIPKTSKNANGALNMILALTSKDAQQLFSQRLGIPSVRDDLLATASVTNSFETIFNRSAIISRGILEPDVKQSNAIIKELIDTIVSGQYEVSVAVERAQEKLRILFNE